MNTRKKAGTTSTRDIVKACDALIDSGAIVRNASAAHFVSAASTFIAMASDLAHTVKMFFDVKPREAPHCKVHDADDPIPGRICGRPLPCHEHGAVRSLETDIIIWARKLAFCEHPADKRVSGTLPTCASCGAVKLHDSGWALPLRLIMVQSLIKGLDEDRLKSLAKKGG